MSLQFELVNGLDVAMVRTEKWLIGLLALLLQVSGAALGTPTPNPSSADATYEQGVAAMAEGKPAKARERFSEALKADAKHLPSLVLLSEIELSEGKLDAAEALIKRAQGIAPGDARVLTQSGKLAYLRGHLDEAQRAFEQAIKADPSKAAAYVELGALQLASLDRPDLAAQSYGKAVTLAPDQITYRYGFATALARAGKLKDALGVLDDVAKKVPKDPLPWATKAALLTSATRYDEAITAMSRAVNLAPKSSAILASRGRIYAAKDDFVRSEQDFQAALKLDDKNQGVRFELANLRLQRGDFAGAEVLYKDVLKADPNNADVYNNLAFGALRDKGRLADALAWAQKAAKLRPKDANIQDTLASVQRARGDLKAAANTLKAIPADARSASMAFHLGQVLFELNDKAGAKVALEAALASKAPFAEQKDAKALLQRVK